LRIEDNEEDGLETSTSTTIHDAGWTLLRRMKYSSLFRVEEALMIEPLKLMCYVSVVSCGTGANVLFFPSELEVFLPVVLPGQSIVCRVACLPLGLVL